MTMRSNGGDALARRFFAVTPLPQSLLPLNITLAGCEGYIPGFLAPRR